MVEAFGFAETEVRSPTEWRNLHRSVLDEFVELLSWGLGSSCLIFGVRALSGTDLLHAAADLSHDAGLRQKCRE